MLSYNEKLQKFIEKQDRELTCVKCNSTGLLPQRTEQDYEDSINRIIEGADKLAQARGDRGITRDEFDKMANLSTSGVPEVIEPYQTGVEGCVKLGAYYSLIIPKIVSSIKKNNFCKCYARRQQALEDFLFLENIPNTISKFAPALIEEARDVRIDELSFKNSQVVSDIEELVAYALCNGLKKIKIFSISELLGILAKSFVRMDLDGVLVYGVDSYIDISDQQANLLRGFFQDVQFRRIPLIIHSEERRERVFQKMGIDKYLKNNSKVLV